MAWRQSRPPFLLMTEIDANRLAVSRDRARGAGHTEAIEAANHMAALARESARLLSFVKGV